MEFPEIEIPGGESEDGQTDPAGTFKETTVSEVPVNTQSNDKSHSDNESTAKTQSPGGSTVKSPDKKDSNVQSSDTSKPEDKTSNTEDVQKGISQKE